MANWAFKVDFASARNQYHKSEITIQALATVVVAKLKPIYDRLYKRAQSETDPDADVYSEDADDLSEIISSFEYVANTPHANDVDFDEALAELYDWADGKTPRGNRYLWIEPS